jgi:hypothetical protein
MTELAHGLSNLDDDGVLIVPLAFALGTGSRRHTRAREVGRSLLLCRVPGEALEWAGDGLEDRLGMGVPMMFVMDVPSATCDV